VCGADDGTLFLTGKGQAIAPEKLTGRVGAYVAAAGLSKTGSCHLFRHTAATLMLENGADIRFIQAMLGHESLDTTQIYAQVGVAKLAAVHAATHPGAMPKREALDIDDADDLDD
jgi:integrase/recombinase XerD